MKKIRIPIVPILVVALVVAGVFWMFKRHDMSSKAEAEAAAQIPERKEDERRLALFYQGYKRFKADHHGADPGSLEVMLAGKYLDPNLLTAPTSVRWQDKYHVPISAGTITYNHKTYKVTYGFLFLKAGFSRDAKRLGDESPLVESDAEEQGMYLAVFNKRPTEDSYSDEGRKSLPGSLVNVKKLAVRLNGTVGEINEADLQAAHTVD